MTSLQVLDLPRLLGRLHRSHPGIAVSLSAHPGGSAALVDAVADVSLADLAGERWTDSPVGFGNRAAVDAALARSGLVRAVALESTRRTSSPSYQPSDWPRWPWRVPGSHAGACVARAPATTSRSARSSGLSGREGGRGDPRRDPEVGGRGRAGHLHHRGGRGGVVIAAVLLGHDRQIGLRLAGRTDDEGGLASGAAVRTSVTLALSGGGGRQVHPDPPPPPTAVCATLGTVVRPPSGRS